MAEANGAPEPTTETDDAKEQVAIAEALLLAALENWIKACADSRPADRSVRRKITVEGYEGLAVGMVALKDPAAVRAIKIFSRSSKLSIC